MARKATLISSTIILSTMAYISYILQVADHNSSGMDPIKTYDSVVHDLQQTSFDKFGAVKSVFLSPQVKHYPIQDYALIDKPDFSNYNGATLWHITSDFGKNNSTNDQMYLWGHVHIVQPSENNAPPTIITTTHATLYPHQSLAKTDADITINRSNTIINGTGAIANMKTGTLQLLAHTRGHYEPSQTI